MTNFALLVICLLSGILLRIGRRVPENAHLSFNGFIIHVALPALILSNIHAIHLTRALLWPVLMPWIMFALSAAAFGLLGHLAGVSRRTTGALIITAGLANTSFVGLPMIETFYGVKDLSIGILIDQLGTYLVLSTAGITVACIYSSGAASYREIALRIVKFPPLIALCLAFVLNGVEYPSWVTGLLHRLGDTLAPLALLSVGLQLRLEHLRGNRLPLSLGLAFKLGLAPVLLAILYVGFLSRHGEVTRVTLFESAMGPQIGGAIVAIQYGLNPPLVSLMVGLGIILSFLTLPLWYVCLIRI